MEKGKGNMASTAAQKAAASKSKQEVWEPLRKEGKGMDEASQVAEAEVAESDDGTDTDTDDDEGAVEAPCNNNLAAKLGNGGVILALVETKTGFAIFMYDGIKLLQEDALQNIWVAFSDHKLAERSVWLLEYRPFEPKVSAINSNGVSDELADMIIRRVDVGLEVSDAIFIACEKSMLDEKDCFTMSKGMRQLLNTHSFILEPEDMEVSRYIINLAGVVRECDRSVKRHDYSLRSAAAHLKRISRIDTQGWDLMKLATALKMNPPTLVPDDVLGRYTCISSHQLHRTNEPGILSMHMHPSKDIVATGGIDTNAVFFDRPSGQILCTLTGHSKKINTLKFVNADGLFITGSADKTVRIWHGSEYGNYSCRHIVKDHNAEVTAVTVQAGEKHFVSASKDNSWCLCDISTASCLLKVDDAFQQSGYTSASFHPHGPLLGIGTTTAFVKLWDMKSKENVANLKGHVGPVTAMSFSENGYLLATAAHDGVRLWDVRKLTNLRTISPYDSGTATNTVEFDPSGSYLGIGGSDARIYKAHEAEWNIVKTLPDLSGMGKVTSLKFGAGAEYIAVGSMDCNLRIFGLPSPRR
ncbi:hypothetical protein HU200_019652 [Digitaria exilis]|uniref:Pre-mRNA-processing factor 19 n=1 Tax=Digitaria exilis TaxID=1010633 RepID=A0A835KF92_9POAL|nr:hypothetical protein HU200_019652 [Digitaria exilis]